MNTNIVTTTWKENMLFESDNPGGHNLLIDTSEAHGGNDAGYRPKALMLSWSSPKASKRLRIQRGISAPQLVLKRDKLW